MFLFAKQDISVKGTETVRQVIKGDKAEKVARSLLCRHCTLPGYSSAQRSRGLTLKWLHSWWLTLGICRCLLQNVKQGMIFPSFEPALWGSSGFTGWKEKSALGGNAPLWEWTLNRYGNEPGSRCIGAKCMPFHTQVFLWPILSSIWNLQIPGKVCFSNIQSVLSPD